MSGRLSGRLGVIVNPVAGMGGRVALHGTDGATVLAEAKQRGARPVSPARARRALEALARAGAHCQDGDRVEVLAAPGPMGAAVAAAAGVPCRVLPMRIGRTTTASETVEAAERLRDAGVELILFAGGDGTAADVLRGAGADQPILGVPSGVKMRSGVFATGPEAAGEVAAEFLARQNPPRRLAEVLDVPAGMLEQRHPEGEPAAGESGVAGGRRCAGSASALGGELLGLATVPGTGRGKMAGPKTAVALGSPVELEAMCAAVAAELEPATTYLFGPGSTTGLVLDELGLVATPLGVDAVRDRQLVGRDLGEAEILELVERSAPVRLVLGVVGGQGMLLGRGNQQLGPRVLERLGPDDVTIVSSAAKLLALDPPRLVVDAGDEAPVSWLAGYRKVRVGPARYLVMQVVAAA
jgi:predicted polyphosphate/ATP-dependent NAD kinase